MVKQPTEWAGEIALALALQQAVDEDKLLDVLVEKIVAIRAEALEAAQFACADVKGDAESLAKCILAIRALRPR